MSASVPDQTTADIVCKLLDPKSKELRDITTVNAKRETILGSIIFGEIYKNCDELIGINSSFFSLRLEDQEIHVERLTAFHKPIIQVHFFVMKTVRMS